MLQPFANTKFGLRYFEWLAIAYLFGVASATIADFFHVDVENIYRIPVVNARWIDLAIILITAKYFLENNSSRSVLAGTTWLRLLSLTYILFEIIQLIRSWGLIDASAQVSRLICTLSLFSVIDLSRYVVAREDIILFVRRFAFWAAIILLITNAYLVYSFVNGKTVVGDSEIRVSLDVTSLKESIYTIVIIPLVYGVGLYVITTPSRLWERVIFFASILSIFITMVLSFHRGTLFVIAAMTIYFFLRTVSIGQMLVRATMVFLPILAALFFFGDMLAAKGYDPIERISETARFSFDYNDPAWDKGRSISYDYAIQAWQSNFWFGAGYDELGHYGLPEHVATAHNGFLTSLFHRGLIGTVLLMAIILILYLNAAKLWRKLGKDNSKDNDIIKILVIVAFFWLVPFLTQEALWEKYSMSIQYMYLGLITNFLKPVIPTSL